jgi:hypothetical protein
MRKLLLPLCTVLLALACSKPTLDDLRRQPPPLLQLELNLPDSPDGAALQQAYEAGFRMTFAGGLTEGVAPASADRIQLLVVITRRDFTSDGEAQRNEAFNVASTLGSPRGLATHYAAPWGKTSYESTVARIGYRPHAPSGQVLLIKPGKGGFQVSYKLEASAVLKYMQPLPEKDRNAAGLLAEEGRAAALGVRELLQQETGYYPLSLKAP